MRWLGTTVGANLLGGLWLLQGHRPRHHRPTARVAECGTLTGPSLGAGRRGAAGVTGARASADDTLPTITQQTFMARAHVRGPSR